MFKPTKVSFCDSVVIKPLEVEVYNNNFEDAFRRFKSAVQAEGIVAKVKERGSYEKPSVRRRRKKKEAAERKFLMELREQQIASGEWEKRVKKKEQKRLKKIEERKKKMQELAT